MRSTFAVGRVKGIAIFVHWSWFFAVAFITISLTGYFDRSHPNWNEPTSVAVAAVSSILLFATVLVHELAHAFTARSHDIPVENITLFIFGGVANLDREPQSPRVELLVTLAGPVASATIAGGFYAVYLFAGGLPSPVSAIVGYLAWVNVILALFNLIPGFPLDGGRVLRAIVWRLTGDMRRATFIATTVGRAIGYLFIVAGAADALFLGDLGTGLWVAFVGWFLLTAARSTYQSAIVDGALSGIDVRAVMDYVTVSIPVDASISTVVTGHILGGTRHAVPVVAADEETLLGIVTLADLDKVSQQEWSVAPIGRAMTPIEELCTVSPELDLRSALRKLSENHFHQLPVLESKRLVGMLVRVHVLQYVQVRRRLAAASTRDL